MLELGATYEKLVYEWLPVAASVVAVVGALGTTVHVLVYKREERSAIGWIGLVWLSPFIGFLLYILLGINRVRRRAQELRAESARIRAEAAGPDDDAVVLREQLPAAASHLAAVADVIDTDSVQNVVGGNLIEPLHSGDEAYPAMLQAIDEAKSSVHLMSYIFDNDIWGARFVQALGRAVERGVAARVLVDAAGARYSIPTIVSELRRVGVQTRRFNPATLIPPRIITVNLRNHRKIMVVDGRLGFTGGMNIRKACVLADEPRGATADLHFRVQGPVVAHLQETFLEDWRYVTRESLEGDDIFPDLAAVGTTFARGITDGPDEDIDRLRWALLAAISAACSYIRIVTPYFLPDESIREALVVARKRGVVVDVILPERSNLIYVDWASRGHLEQLLDHGVGVFLAPAPFHHGKLMVVDDGLVILGSANWDPRSLRLNFEFNLECYDPDLARTMDAWARERRDRGSRYSVDEHGARGWGVRLLHNAFRLFTPYL